MPSLNASPVRSGESCSTTSSSSVRITSGPHHRVRPLLQRSASAPSPRSPAADSTTSRDRGVRPRSPRTWWPPSRLPACRLTRFAPDASRADGICSQHDRDRRHIPPSCSCAHDPISNPAICKRPMAQLWRLDFWPPLSGLNSGPVARRPCFPLRIPAPATGAPGEVTWEPGPFLPLVQERDSTHAAQEVAGLERLGELLVWGNRSRFHGGQRTRVLRHQYGRTPSVIFPASPFSQIVSVISVLAELGARGHVEVLSPNTAGASRIEIEGRPVAR